MFFIAPNDPRFINTLKAINRPRDKGGLVENGLCYRYDTNKVDDGTGGGEEGAFTMCSKLHSASGSIHSTKLTLILCHSAVAH